MARLTGGLSLILAVVLIVVGVGVMLYPWSKAEATKPVSDKFGEDRAATDPLPFDAKRAMGYLDDLCKIGPRMSGTDGMKQQQELLKKHFEKRGGKITWQKFTGKQRDHEAVEMANLIVSWQPDKARRVILCSHYDSPIADQEPQQKKWHEPFISPTTAALASPC